MTMTSQKMTFEDLVKDCEEEMQRVQRKNFILCERVRAKMEVCRNSGHIHVHFWLRDKFSVSYVIHNDEQREAMHNENSDLVRDLIQDKEVIDSTTVVSEDGDVA